MDEEEGYFCAPKIQEAGVNCTETNECRWGDCPEEEPRVCPPKRPEEGEVCDDIVLSSTCVPGLFCNETNVCEKWREQGWDCSSNEQCKDGLTCHNDICTRNEELPCHDDTSDYTCQGGCNCANGANAEGTCAGGPTACQRSYEAMEYCERMNCLTYYQYHFYPFDPEGCFQRHCKEQVAEYYKCQEDFFHALDQRFPDLPFYNMDFADEPSPPVPPPPPPQDDSETSDGSSLHVISWRVGLLAALCAAALYILQ